MDRKRSKLNVKGTIVRIIKIGGHDFVCLSDMAKIKSDDPTFTINHWMRNRMTIEYLGLWEELYNPYFKPTEFGRFRDESGLNSFTLSPSKWIKNVNAIGMVSQPGRYGGTFARSDIAFKFAAWLSVEFELYLIKEFQRLKAKEQRLIGWSIKRELAKINYHIQTDAVKENLIPTQVSQTQMDMIYANEADVLNVALFGQTHHQWQLDHPNLKGNQRDYATVNQLICLSNMENINAVMINDGVSQSHRLKKLNEIAIQQMRILSDVGRKYLKTKDQNKTVNTHVDKELLEKEQIVHIKAGLKQAKEKQFASDEEVKKAFDKWAK